ncbi:MAG: amino acid adenylation domain-containing protein, partial [Lachnospiraceae bacterium]|nr:amino acid adenylation domain-containing protein [Lachnospiraceae bacterium]
RIAFADPEKSIAFGKLNEMVKQVATLLLKGSICTPLMAEDGVGFFMEKSTDAVCAMLGVVMTGAFYSFIDVRQPAERAASVINVLSPRIIITDRNNEEALRGIITQTEFKIILIDELLEHAAGCAKDEGLLEHARDRMCDTMPLYVNFTSGSTGTPKGVAVSHRSVIDFIRVFTETFDITHEDVMANQAPFDFDVSVKDVYSGLYTGARVQLIPRDYFSNPSVLMDYLANNGVTVLVWAVSAMCFVSIMNGLEYRTPETIGKVMFSGEVMPVKHLNKWRKFLPDATYVNLYGPTEITCNCTYYILDHEFGNDEAIPAGIPFANEKVFLLDESDSLVEEPGTPGEICVSGTCLALGYYRDPVRTKEAFMQNPLNDRYSEMMYRTGDLGKYDEDGNLVYVSRKDFQIKHMGQRIELGEIETAAMAADGVTRACCIYNTAKKRIELFYTGETEKKELSDALKQKLPQFMIPGRTVKLDEMPMNKNGKIDRQKLSGL